MQAGLAFKQKPTDHWITQVGALDNSIQIILDICKLTYGKVGIGIEFID